MHPSRFGIAGGYLAGVDHSGRGFNPRPAPGRPAQAGTRPTGTGRHQADRHRPAPGRPAQAGTRPTGTGRHQADRHRPAPGRPAQASTRPTGTGRLGSDGTINPRQMSLAISNPKDVFPKGNSLIDFCFLDSVSLPSRGWIVPVGGATPDRHQADRHRPAQSDRLRPAQRGGGQKGGG